MSRALFSIAVRYAVTRRELDDCNAFLDSSVAEEECKRLRMPGKAVA